MAQRQAYNSDRVWQPNYSCQGPHRVKERARAGQTAIASGREQKETITDLERKKNSSVAVAGGRQVSEDRFDSLFKRPNSNTALARAI
jgi:hypothetical protein